MARIQRYLPQYCYSSSMMKSVTGIVIHYFSGKFQFPEDLFDTEKCYQLFKDLNRDTNNREQFKMKDVPDRMYASAHFMIARDGTVIDLVPIPNKAWHAGKSEWNNKADCNSWMVGIELISDYDSEYTNEQYAALIELTRELIKKYNISWDNITGHENVAPGRKTDPGPEFDWARYREMKQPITSRMQAFIDDNE